MLAWNTHHFESKQAVLESQDLEQYKEGILDSKRISINNQWPFVFYQLSCFNENRECCIFSMLPRNVNLF